MNKLTGLTGNSCNCFRPIRMLVLRKTVIKHLIVLDSQCMVNIYYPRLLTCIKHTGIFRYSDVRYERKKIYQIISRLSIRCRKSSLLHSNLKCDICCIGMTFFKIRPFKLRTECIRKSLLPVVDS